MVCRALCILIGDIGWLRESLCLVFVFGFLGFCFWIIFFSLYLGYMLC